MDAHLVSIVKGEDAKTVERTDSIATESADPNPSIGLEPAIRAKPQIPRKILAIIIVASVITASGAFVWALFIRPWSTEEIGNQVINDPTQGAPGFKHGLAGRTVTVSGRLTQLETYETNRGPIHVLTLDDYKLIRLVTWGPTSYEVGDHVSIPVRFEWTTINEERHVYSPQIDFPWFYLLPIGPIIESVSYVAGMVLQAEDLGEGRLRVTIHDQYPPVSVALANCTWRSGERSWVVEYVESLISWKYGHEIDQLSNLSSGVSENGLVSFSDTDHDGNLSRGDWFDIKGVERPSEEGGLKSYMLNVGLPGPIGYSTGGVCYVVLTHDGLLSLQHVTPYARIALENRADGTVEATVAAMSGPASWENVTIQLSDGTNYGTWSPMSSSLTGAQPSVSNLGDVTLGPLSAYCAVTDLQGNGLMDEGDSMIFGVNSGNFSLRTNYTVTLLWEPTLSQLGTSRSFTG